MKKMAAGLVAGLILGLAAPALTHVPASACPAEDMLKRVVDYGDGHAHYRCVNTDDYIARTITRTQNYQVDGAIQGDVCNNRRYWERNYGIAPVVAEACEGH